MTEKITSGEQPSGERRKRRFRDLTPEEQADLLGRMRHSAAHVLAEAVLELFPQAKLTIGPPTDDGFYYDFDVAEPFNPDDLERIEGLMRESVKANKPFVEREVDAKRHGGWSAITHISRRSSTGFRKASGCRFAVTATSMTCAGAATSPRPARSGRSGS